ncbi:MAG: peptide chain release factor 2 [bacterium]|nr:peptide chain release factor 2 [bacterium]
MSKQEKDLQILKTSVEEARTRLQIEKKMIELQALEAQMASPDFWNDSDAAQKVSQDAADLNNEIESWDGFIAGIDDAAAMIELAGSEEDDDAMEEAEQMIDALQKRFEKAELATLLTGPYDRSNAIISIHAGAGGTDAMDFAEMLLRMYVRYAEGRDWKVDVTHESRGEEAGIKSVTFTVKGTYGYGYLKEEAGVHRLVRISPFDAEGLRHTSFALVEVIPELDKLTEAKLDLNMDEVRIDTFMASGKGGQSVNTTYSAVRVTHLPTSTVVSCQNERSQLQNKETALRILKSRLMQRMMEERAEKLDEIRGGHKSPEWGNQIRSYVLQPYQLVKDHRTNTEVKQVDKVLGGDIDVFIEASLKSAE